MSEPSTWQAIGWLAVALFSLAGGINQVTKLVDRWRGHPPAETLKASADELTRRVSALEENAQEAMERRRAMHGKIDAVESKVRADVKQDLGNVYERLNSVSQSIAGLARDTEHYSRQMAHIEAKLDRLIERSHS